MLHLTDFSRILVVAPHVDDEIHCAATARKLVEQGCDVGSVSFSFCEESLPIEFSLEDIIQEHSSSLDLIGIKHCFRWERGFQVREFLSRRQEILEQLVEVKREFAPTVVLCPSSTDTHQDHRVVFDECERLFRDTTVLGYIHALNMRQINPTLFVPVRQRQMAVKRDAWSCYRSQNVKASPFGAEWIDLQAKTWGKMCGYALAEAFEFIRGAIH